MRGGQQGIGLVRGWWWGLLVFRCSLDTSGLVWGFEGVGGLNEGGGVCICGAVELRMGDAPWKDTTQGGIEEGTDGYCEG